MSSHPRSPVPSPLTRPASLPADYAALSFNPAAGINHNTTFVANGSQFIINLVVTVSDMTALLRIPDRTVIWDGSNGWLRLPGDADSSGAEASGLGLMPALSLPESVQTWARQPGPRSVAAAVLRPSVILRAQGNVVGATPLAVGRPLLFGRGEGSLSLALWFAAAELTAGYLRRPGENGAVILGGVRELTSGIAFNSAGERSTQRPNTTVMTETDTEAAYGQLA